MASLAMPEQCLEVSLPGLKVSMMHIATDKHRLQPTGVPPAAQCQAYSSLWETKAIYPSSSFYPRQCLSSVVTTRMDSFFFSPIPPSLPIMSCLCSKNHSTALGLRFFFFLVNLGRLRLKMALTYFCHYGNSYPIIYYAIKCTYIKLVHIMQIYRDEKMVTMLCS